MDQESDNTTSQQQPAGELPLKPPGSTWTDEQWHAVVAGGSDILVAAAAGSGKTAVLVERIIRKISADTDVDRLLVATFTKAAAAEMKERIRLALERALHQQPQSEHLRRQLAMMGRASITTLHSFCLDVIRRYYPMIGLDPGFRVANETEAELMRLDVLDELFEQRYAASDVDLGFLRLADDYGGERGDEPLYRLVQELYDFSRSHPWPDHWLRETAAAFKIPDVETLGRSDWVGAIAEEAALALSGAREMLASAVRCAGEPGGPAAYLQTLQEELAAVDRLAAVVETAPWASWHEAFAVSPFGKLKALRGDDIDKSLQERVKSLRDGAKKLIGELASELFSRQPGQFLEELQGAAPQMMALASLVIDFAGRYEQAKRAKGLLDFGDLEHYCLRILRSPASTPEGSLPSAAALEYRRQFDEILLDEYQDTNRVQEAIVELIAREGRGNRFMVGDVKQSIYRFRLAEPGLFLAKYKAYASGAGEDGLRIDLARNFRSRVQVVDGVNDVFRAIMRETVAEMDYDRAAELVSGASYPPAGEGGGPFRVELTVLDRADASGDDEASEGEPGVSEAPEDVADVQTAQLEARYIAAQIHRLREGGEDQAPFRVYDGKRQTSRTLAWRDIVILLRATSQWAPILIEELQAHGIPAYAELNTGYFDATEVEVMLSLLRVIDNPYQDIPLAGVLRSPIFGLTAEELAMIRVYAGKRGPYYDAVLQGAANLQLPEQIRSKLALFLDRLSLWREEARQGSLAELVWQIYRSTGYYDFVGGLPGGLQRQANLRALHDRARQYEQTSFRGLFRFLRFVDRMRERGGDLGTARALGEQEDVVRIMSIHRSKGLEFPVVFTAGLGKQFNMQDLNRPFLMHKELGFGPRHVDGELRVSYPTLPQLAIRRKQRMELLAEEMRILYVAMTRPKEKLFLVGTLAGAGKQLSRWQESGAAPDRIPDYTLAAARRFTDWLLPLVGALPARPLEGGSGWTCALMPAELYAAEAAAAEAADPEAEGRREERIAAIAAGAVLPEESDSLAAAIDARLSWRYPHSAATMLAAKTSVTEMKRLQAEWGHAEQAITLEEARGGEATAGSGPLPAGVVPPGTLKLRRPRFMEERSLSAAERGTVSHLVMQHVPLGAKVTPESLSRLIEEMLERRLLTIEQAAAVDLDAVQAYFGSPLGQRMLQADWVRREVPFSCTLPAGRIYPQAVPGAHAAAEPVLIQGVIDCLFEDEQGLVLVDYKTDRIVMQQWDAAAERHRFQLELYAEAVGAIVGKPVAECHVFFFDGAQAVRLQVMNEEDKGGG
ncbi:helicase-exonuclease AddAB subunit AddA [Paenibacillus sp. 1P07SE]|uniref:helicase-exonuclease AddAB subunit AddA n=1 Tax=Paenibacillus sp. 1P07SE TaxID=3132209 RepID=UPI0039A6A470